MRLDINICFTALVTESVYGVEEYETMKHKIDLTKEEEQRALDLHRRFIFVNGLDSTPLEESDETYFSKLLESGITAVNTTIYAYPMKAGLTGPLHEILDAIAIWYSKVERSSTAIIATSVDDIRTAKKNGRFAVILGTQNGDFLMSTDMVKVFRRLGLRIVQPTYQRRNTIGDGCGERNPAGLSQFGVKLVEELNKQGIVIDLSHVGKGTTMDCINVSRDPVIISHTAARSLSDMVRCKTDEEIKAMAEKGGVMGITPKSNFLKPRGAATGTTIEDYMDHIDHVVNLVGVNHIGVGLDVGYGRGVTGKYSVESMGEFDSHFPEVGIWKPGDDIHKIHTTGLEPPVAKVLNITRGAVARGYSDQEVEKIVGGNFLRLFEGVWKRQ